MVDRRRYSPHGRFGALATPKRESGLPQLYRGRAASSLKDLYETDHAESRQVGRFRWLISTCLAGTRSPQPRPRPRLDALTAPTTGCHPGLGLPKSFRIMFLAYGAYLWQTG